MESLFVEWLTGPFCESLCGTSEYSLEEFIKKYPQFNDMKENDIDYQIIENILPHIDVNTLYKSKRIYHYFIETLLIGNRYAYEIFNYGPDVEHYDRFIQYFFNSIGNKEDFLPLLIPDSQIRDFCEDKEDIYHQIGTRGVIIGYFIILDTNFEKILKEYVPEWDEIRPEYWEDILFPDPKKEGFSDQQNGFLRYLKYSVNGFLKLKREEQEVTGMSFQKNKRMSK